MPPVRPFEGRALDLLEGPPRPALTDQPRASLTKSETPRPTRWLGTSASRWRPFRILRSLLQPRARGTHDAGARPAHGKRD